MTLTSEDKHKIYHSMLSTLACMADNLTSCQENISALMSAAHDQETADILLIMTDVLQALNLALAWTDGAADRVGVLRKLFEPVVLDAPEPEGEDSIYLMCGYCGIRQPVKDGYVPGDMCPVCRKESLEDVSRF